MAEWLHASARKAGYLGSSPSAASKKKRREMPVQKIGANKFRWGNKGKVYPTKTRALKQGRAIKASQARAKKK